MKITILLNLIVLLLTTGFTPAATHLVPDDYATIQDAIDACVDGGVVIVAPGTYTGDGNRDIDFNGKAITVRSIEPTNPNVVAATIINCQGTREQPHRAFYFHSGEDKNSVLDGFTIINGYASSVWPEQMEWSGGGILCRHGSSPTIRNCIITGNTTLNGSGGGISASGGVINNCTIKGNHALGATGYGPGGGGIRCGGKATVSNSIISGNTAKTSGGGIKCTSGNPTIVNCVIVGNSAGTGGGVTCQYQSNAVISNCTISGNFASAFGGGLSSLLSTPRLVNSILWGDSSPRGPEISNGTLHGWLAVITVSFSDVEGGQAHTYVCPDCPLDWGPGNIDADPCFVETGYWADRNDPNIIVEPNDPNAVWIEGDYHLLEDSPCIDTGDPNHPYDPNETDLDGEPRLIGSQIDMGAFESPIFAEVHIVPHTINLTSKGKWIAALLWFPEDYNVTDIDPNSVFLGEQIKVEQLLVNEQEQVAMTRFSREELQAILNAGDIELTITGQLNDGTIFKATDVIKVLDKSGNRPAK